MRHTELNKPAIVMFSMIALIQFVLFVLKMTNIITCSWLWVLAPLWVPYAILILMGSFIAVLFIVTNIHERIFKKHGR